LYAKGDGEVFKLLKREEDSVLFRENKTSPLTNELKHLPQC